MIKGEEYLKKLAQPQYVEGVLEEPETDLDSGGAALDGAANGESDPLYDQAVEIVLKTRRA